MRDFATASNEYKLGRMGRKPHDLGQWPQAALDAYNDGVKDRAKARRRQGYKDAVENVFVGILAFFGIIISVIAWAVVVALPFIIVAFALHLMGAF